MCLNFTEQLHYYTFLYEFIKLVCTFYDTKNKNYKLRRSSYEKKCCYLFCGFMNIIHLVPFKLIAYGITVPDINTRSRSFESLIIP